MKFDESILKNEEKAIFALRKLYASHGYTSYKMSKFEEYDLYSENKDFLVSDGIITFHDTRGKLLALKPDVTLSILKNYNGEDGAVQKYYYNENVYRISESSHTFKEIMQTGLECIGTLTENDVSEVIALALESLSLISDDFVLNLSHAGLLGALLQEAGLTGSLRKRAETAIRQRNEDALRQAVSGEGFEKLRLLITNNADPSLLKEIERVADSDDAKAALSELETVVQDACRKGYGEHIRIDFSISDSSRYYSGVVFKGFVSGIATRVLSGGRYDGLMRKMGRHEGAIGFAVYLDTLERVEENVEAWDGFVNVALPKGRLGESVYRQFEAAGYECPAVLEKGRKLIFENKEKKIRYFWVKPSDVAIYVERGAADIGVAGKDILLESEPDVYELLDMKCGKCRMAVAAKKDFQDDTSKTLRVATKFSNIARGFYAEKCREIELIHLNGSIELAPILGLSDVIVDIVETGKTLIENDLEPVETIVPISARLIANRASFQFKADQIDKIKCALQAGLEQEND